MKRREEAARLERRIVECLIIEIVPCEQPSYMFRLLSLTNRRKSWRSCATIRSRAAPVRRSPASDWATIDKSVVVRPVHDSRSIFQRATKASKRYELGDLDLLNVGVFENMHPGLRSVQVISIV